MTAELAVAIPALLVVLFGGLFVVAAVGAQQRCLDAAGQVASSGARGDDQAVALGRRLAPPGARISLSRSQQETVAVVSAPVTALGGVLPTVRVSATARAATEPVLP